MTKVFTDLWLRSVVKDRRNVGKVFWDNTTTGLVCRIAQSGVRFYAVARLPGAASHTWTMVARYPDDSLAVGRQKAKDALELIRSGVSPRAVKLAKRRAAAQALRDAAGRTFGAYVEEWITEYVKDPELRSAEETVAIARRELISRWKDWPADSITRHDVIQMVNAIIDRKTAGSRSGGRFAARRAFSAAKGIFDWCVRMDKLTVDPTANIKPKKDLRALGIGNMARSRVLSDDEIRVVWHHAIKVGYPFGPLIQLLMLTGSRLREISTSKYADVDWDKATLTISAIRMKMGIPHVIPLTDTALEIIKGLPRFTRGNYIFSTSMGAAPMGGFDLRKKQFDAAIGDKISEHWVLHDIRRTFRTGLAQLGVSPFIAELALAHQAKKGVAAIYDKHLYLSDLRDALVKYESKLLSIVNPPPENVVALKRVRARL